MELFLKKDCDKCQNLKKSRAIVVVGYGDPHAQIMFVGMAPGRNGADRTGIPFTRDPSGILFQECLIAAGFSLEQNPRNELPRLKNVYVTNLVKCNPKQENGCNRTPSLEEIKNCAPFFEQEIISVNPDVIVLFGKVVSEYVLKHKIARFTDCHNIPQQINGRKFLPFIHPSFVIRGAYDRQKYIREIVGLKKYLL
jgi:uracil-DNA glycosylase